MLLLKQYVAGPYQYPEQYMELLIYMYSPINGEALVWNLSTGTAVARPTLEEGKWDMNICCCKNNVPLALNLKGFQPSI